jgi:isoamylase
MDQLTIYEAHVQDLTAKCQYVEKEHQGKFFGACHPYVIDHLKKLGVNAIQFMPVFDSVSTHWGYDAKSWFELNPNYGSLGEFKLMCKTFQDSGIKVILDVVYNHLHGEHKGVVKGGKGFSGCGDDVRVDLSLSVIQESINYWMQYVDGMRFDLAPVLFRENNYFNPDGKFAQYIKTHADNGKIIIAEPWDCGGYVEYGKYGFHFVGQFPKWCLEHNDSIRDAVRRGGTYYCGDNYKKYIGFATCHDGYTLADLVGYNNKHNEHNGEYNKDGCNNNYSNNHGEEGPTKNQWIIKAREKTKARMMQNLRTSCYHIMLLMGDEFGRTQNGCNNGYKTPCPVIWP